MNDSDGIARSLPRISPYRGGEPVLQGNTRFSVLLKAPRHKKMRGSNPYVGALPLCGKNPRVDSCCVFHTCSRSGEPVLQGNTRFYFFSYDTVIL